MDSNPFVYFLFCSFTYCILYIIYYRYCIRILYYPVPYSTVATVPGYVNVRYNPSLNDFHLSLTCTEL